MKYVQITVAIHGLDADQNAIGALVDSIRASVRESLLGDRRDLFRWRDEFDSDIEIEVTESA